MYEVYRGGRLPLRNLVWGRTSLFRPLHGQTLSSRMRTPGTSATQSMSPMTEASQCTAGTVPVPDGLPTGG
jgi:hypothetical protein